MNIKQAFKMSFKSISSNKIRSFLTMLGIVIGVAAVIILVSLVQGYQSSMMEYYEKQGVNKINIYAYDYTSQRTLSQDLYDYCLSLDDLVLGVTPNVQIWGKNIKYQAKTEQDAQIYLGSEQFSTCNNYTLSAGRDLCYLDIKQYKKVCVIGGALQKKLFDYSNPIGATININGESYTVIGTYAKKYEDEENNYMDNILVVPYTTVRWLEPSMTMDSYVVKAVDKSSTTEAITRLNGFLSGRINDERGGYYDVWSENTYIESSNEQTRMIQLVLAGIAGIALLVGGIGIMNIMLVTVTERTREIGIRKAIGAKRRVIVGQFLIESAVVSFFGGLFGIILGILLTLVLGKLIFSLVIWPSMLIGVGAAVFSALIGVVFGIYPAWKASGLQPVVALRAE